MKTESLNQVKVACYCRVSTDEQARRRNPILTQREVCSRTCERHFGPESAVLEFFIDEGLSGTLGVAEEGDRGRHRPEFTRMVDQIGKGEVDWICCQDLDRLGRKETVLFELWELLGKHGVKLLTPERTYDLSNPSDFLTSGIQSVVSAFQPRQTAIKTAEGKRTRARRGLPKSGAAPYGWRLQSVQEADDPQTRRLVPVPEQAKWMAEMAELYQSGWGYQRIADHLVEQGAPPPGRAGWYKVGVKSLLQNPKHAGLIRVDEGEYVKGAHFADRIYEPAVFHDLQREMAKRASIPAALPTSSYFCTGVLTCGECESMMRASTHSETRYYQCSGGWADTGRACSNRVCKADHVEIAVLQVVRDFVLSDEVAKLVSGELDELLTQDDGVIAEQVKENHRERARLETEVRWLISKAAHDPKMREHFDAEIGERRERLERLAAEAEQLEAQCDDASERQRRAARVHAIASDFDTMWAGSDGSERRQVISQIFDEMVLSRAEGGSILRLRIFLGEPREVFMPAAKQDRRPKYGLQALTLRACAALYLHDEGLTDREIAERWGTKVPNVRGHLMRARKKLRVETTEEALELSRDYIRKLLPFLPLEGPIAVDPTPEDLTPTERKLLPDIANRELTYADIAEKYGIAENTIKVHASNIARTLRARGRAELIQQARRLGLV